MTIPVWVWAPTVLGVAVGLAAVLYLRAFLRWHDRQTDGVAYFGRPLEERRALKREIARRGWLARPMVRVLARLSPSRNRFLPGTEYRGVTAPAPTCPQAAFERAARYRPAAGDVFVATQMKCGTTWMQQVVYEVLSRGRGDLGDSGHRHLYALSPWIESRHSVDLEEAPRVGERGARIIKTHLPTLVCPWGEEARYVYVTRHPVACFASCVDFVRMVGGPMAPPLPALLDWYCSDRMWWRSWPEHVEGWWRWSRERDNVLFVHYEEMLDDLPATVARVAAFLDQPLEPGEYAAVVERSRFESMKAREEVFEMSPPSPFAGEGAFLRSGSRERHRDVGPAERDRILAFCRERLRGASYPAARFYPDLVG